MYKTTDFTQSVVLKSAGAMITNIEKVYGRVEFTFADKEKCEKIILDFLNGKLIGNILEFVRTRDEMLNIVKR